MNSARIKNNKNKINFHPRFSFNCYYFTKHEEENVGLNYSPLKSTGPEQASENKQILVYNGLAE